MFDMRMREEAEGERRMMGSGRELDFRDGMDSPAEGAGTIDEGLTPGFAPGWPGGSRLVFIGLSHSKNPCVLPSQLTVGLIPRSNVFRSPVLRSPL
jgi:hypothetical protein